MNHHKSIRKFGRIKKVREGLMKSLAVSLVTSGKIKTTEAKARELRPFIEKMITSGRTGTLASRRAIIAQIGKAPADILVKDIAPKYVGRAGGYTRITKLPARLSDGSLMAVIEFV